MGESAMGAIAGVRHLARLALDHAALGVTPPGGSGRHSGRRRPTAQTGVTAFDACPRDTVTTAYITHPSCLQHEMGAAASRMPRAADGDRRPADRRRASTRISHRHEAPRGDARAARARPRRALCRSDRGGAPGERAALPRPRYRAQPAFGRRGAARGGRGGAAPSTWSARRKHQTAFCAVRPPGHHAERRRAMGFCVFNNVAVGAAHALEAHGLSRVAIVDFDVHHGNGTEEIFSDDPRVLMVSTFQYPLYPYSGVDNPAPNMVNVPLAAGQRRRRVPRRGARALAARRSSASGRELILISAGFDAHREDPLAGLEFTEARLRVGHARADRRRAAPCRGPHRLVARRRLRAVGARAQRRRARAGADRPPERGLG